MIHNNIKMTKNQSCLMILNVNVNHNNEKVTKNQIVLNTNANTFVLQLYHNSQTKLVSVDIKITSRCRSQEDLNGDEGSHFFYSKIEF